jgi:hypothetical protein
MGVSIGVRRVVLLSLVLVSVMVTTVEPSGAKLPPWTCEPSTTRPVVGQRVEVVVRFWQIPPPSEPIHVRPERHWRIPRLPGFLEARSDGSGATGRRRIAVAVRFVRPGVYHARIVFPASGIYRIEACGTEYDERGYTTPGDALVVRPRALIRVDLGRGDMPPEPDGVGRALVLAGLGAAALAARALRHRFSPDR